MSVINIGDIYKFITSDYISTGIKYLNNRGVNQVAWGPIELYPYVQNEQIYLPCYSTAEQDGHIEDDQHVTILDVIESASYKNSKLYGNTITQNKRVEIVFLLNNKTYIYDQDFFLKISEKVNVDD